MKDEVKPIINNASLASIGYAVPGSVIALSILICIPQLDNTLGAWMHSELRDRNQVSDHTVLTRP
ncbi:MAG TPA: hypothetical protein V6D11_22925 [Waterburya sp.]